MASDACPHLMGIDFGTTSCKFGYFINGKVEIFEDEFGNKSMPSYVAFTKDGRLVGEKAKRQMRENPRNTVFAVKKLMGKKKHAAQELCRDLPFKLTDSENRICGVMVENAGETIKLYPEEVAAMMFSKMKRLAESRVGLSIDGVVISVPPGFNSCQRKATVNAGTIAGFEEVILIDDGTAMAYAYYHSLVTVVPKDIVCINVRVGFTSFSRFKIDQYGFYQKKTDVMENERINTYKQTKESSWLNLDLIKKCANSFNCGNDKGIDAILLSGELSQDENVKTILKERFINVPHSKWEHSVDSVITGLCLVAAGKMQKSKLVRYEINVNRKIKLGTEFVFDSSARIASATKAVHMYEGGTYDVTEFVEGSEEKYTVVTRIEIPKGSIWSIVPPFKYSLTFPLKFDMNGILLCESNDNNVSINFYSVNDAHIQNSKETEEEYVCDVREKLNEIFSVLHSMSELVKPADDSPISKAVGEIQEIYSSVTEDSEVTDIISASQTLTEFQRDMWNMFEYHSKKQQPNIRKFIDEHNKTFINRQNNLVSYNSKSDESENINKSDRNYYPTNGKHSIIPGSQKNGNNASGKNANVTKINRNKDNGRSSVGQTSCMESKNMKNQRNENSSKIANSKKNGSNASCSQRQMTESDFKSMNTPQNDSLVGNGKINEKTSNTFPEAKDTKCNIGAGNARMKQNVIHGLEEGNAKSSEGNVQNKGEEQQRNQTKDVQRKGESNRNILQPTDYPASDEEYGRLERILHTKQQIGKSTGGLTMGIDFGTNKCCVAALVGRNVEVIANEKCKKTTPSYVTFTNNERYFGEDSKNSAIVLLDKTVIEPKNKIFQSESHDSFSVKCRSEDYSLNPVQISSMLIKYMKGVADNHLGQEVKDAIICVPTYFNNKHRQSIREAVAIAGLNVLSILNEPTAAAINYKMNNSEEKTKNINILVFDLGSGGLSVALVGIKEDKLKVYGIDGTTEVSGNVMDEKLVNHFKEEIFEKHGIKIDGMKETEKLRLVCQKIRYELTGLTSTGNLLENFDGASDYKCEITRQKFEGMISEIKEVVVSLLDKLFKNCDFSQTALDEIVLCGGVSRVPFIQNILTDYFKERKCNCKFDGTINADEAVALGAAYHAAGLSKMASIKPLQVEDLVKIKSKHIRELWLAVPQDEPKAFFSKSNKLLITSSGIGWNSSAAEKYEVKAVHQMKEEIGNFDENDKEQMQIAEQRNEFESQCLNEKKKFNNLLRSKKVMSHSDEVLYSPGEDDNIDLSAMRKHQEEFEEFVKEINDEVEEGHERKRAAQETARREAIEKERIKIYEEKEKKRAAAEKERKRAAEVEEKKRAAEGMERKRAAEVKEKKRAAEEMERKRAAEEMEKKRAAEELDRKQAAEEIDRKGAAEEMDKKRAAEEKKRKRAADEIMRRDAIEKERKKIYEEKERKRAAEEMERKKAAEEMERKRAAEERERKRAAEERERKRAAEEMERKRAAEERERKRAAEEMERKRAAEEMERKRAAEERERKRAAEEIERKRAAEERERKRAAEEMERKRAAEERERKRAAEEMERKRAAEEGERKRAAEEMKKKEVADMLKAVDEDESDDEVYYSGQSDY